MKYSPRHHLPRPMKSLHLTVSVYDGLVRGLQIAAGCHDPPKYAALQLPDWPSIPSDYPTLEFGTLPLVFSQAARILFFRLQAPCRESVIGDSGAKCRRAMRARFTCIHPHEHKHSHTSLCPPTNENSQQYTHTCIHMHIRTHVHAQTRKHAHTQTHMLTHSHTHTHTHTHTQHTMHEALPFWVSLVCPNWTGTVSGVQTASAGAACGGRWVV